MDLETLGNLGDFISGIAVLVTLIYLANQVRRNTSVLSTASREAIYSAYRAQNAHLIDTDISEAYAAVRLVGGRVRRDRHERFCAQPGCDASTPRCF